VDYEDICNNPLGIIQSVSSFARKRDIILETQNMDRIPNKFPYRLHSIDLNDHTQRLYSKINEHIVSIKQSGDRKFFRSLI